MCPCEWACVRSGEMRGTHARCAGRRCDDEGVGIHVSVRVGIHVSIRVGIHVSVRVGIHVSVRVGMCLCEWACVCASGHVSVQVGMCLCKWACVHASEMGRCDNHEGVGIRVGGQDISVWGNASGNRCNEGEGECIHVGGSRGHPCRNMQASSRWESLDVGGMCAVHGWGEYSEMLLHNLLTQVSTL